MKRRNFIHNLSSLGLASVTFGASVTAKAMETPKEHYSFGKLKIPCSNEYEVIVVGDRKSVV